MSTKGGVKITTVLEFASVTLIYSSVRKNRRLTLGKLSLYLLLRYRGWLHTPQLHSCAQIQRRSPKMMSPTSNLEEGFHIVHLNCSCFLESPSSVCFTKWILLEFYLLTTFIYVIHNLRVSYIVVNTAMHDQLSN